MRKLILFFIIMFFTGFVIAQNVANLYQTGADHIADVIQSGNVLVADDQDVDATQTVNVFQEGADQYTKVSQVGLTNNVLVQQISLKPQYSWVFQSGEMEDEATQVITPGGEDNYSLVDQSYGGEGNMTFLYQFGSFNKSWQKQNGSNNQFNITGPGPIVAATFQPAMNDETVPNQDGDYHEMTQTANGDFNQAWIYQAGRKHVAFQVLNGDWNQVWTSQSGNTNRSSMLINGTGNGSIYMEHEEGKFPETEGETDEGSPDTGGNGNQGESHGQGDGGMPEVIPPPHDETHVFVPTVGVSIKQMGKNSEAEMYIEGDYNKATITQRGGAGGGDTEQAGHYTNQDIYGNYNRVFANQTGTGNYIDQNVNGAYNLVTFMQKGNGGISVIDLDGTYNEIGVDQKGKSNYSRIDVDGNFNGNFDPLSDEYGVKLAQEGKENHSEIDITGDFNLVNAHQSGGGISYITQTGNYNSAFVNQEETE